MADVRYVVQDYSDEDYLEVGSTFGYFEFEYVANGYVASVVSAEAALTSSFAQQATSVKCRISSLTTTSQVTVVSTGVKCRIGDAVISVAANLTAIPLQIIPAENFTLADSISLSATAVKIFGAEAQLAAEFTQLAIPLRIQPGTTTLQAFNTVVTAAGRIRPAADFSALNATLTASPTKVFGASTNTFATYDASAFPITGVVVEHTPPDSFSGLQLSYRTFTASTDAETFDDIVVSWYSRSYTTTAGVIFSWSGDGLNIPPISISMSGDSINVGGPGGVTWFNIPDTRELHHYAIAFIDRYTGSNELYIDGVRHTNKGGSYGPDGRDWYGNPRDTLAIGRLKTIVNFGYPGGPNDYRVVQSSPWDGEVAQVWVGVPYGVTQFNRITGYTRSTFQSFGPYGNLSGSEQQTIGSPPQGPGRGTDSTLSQPAFYAEYSDADIGEYRLGTLNQLYFAAYPIHGVFTFTPTAFNIKYGVADLQSQFSIQATLGKLQPSAMSSDISTTLTATAYDFTKAVATLASEFATDFTAYDFTKATADLTAVFTFTPDVDEISTGASLVLANVTLTVDGGVIRAPQAVFTSAFSFDSTGNTNQLAYSDLLAVVDFVAEDYDFTKGTVVLDTALTIEATARIFSPPRGTMLSGMQATLTATPLKLRIQTSTIESSTTLLVADGNALRGGLITMTAFDTVLSAGKVIEFLAENTITVTEEQRLLRVALESTVILVEMANGVNSVMAENTDIKVAQEQGLLLAQYNMPN